MLKARNNAESLTYWLHNLYFDNYVNTYIEVLVGWFMHKISTLHYQDVISNTHMACKT